jgi:hypothetical protein
LDVIPRNQLTFAFLDVFAGSGFPESMESLDGPVALERPHLCPAGAVTSHSVCRSSHTGEGITEEGAEDGLFSLATVGGRGAVESLGDAPAPAADELEALEQSSSDGLEARAAGASDADSDDEQE